VLFRWRVYPIRGKISGDLHLVCVRERVGFGSRLVGEVKSSWISWCAMVLSKGDDDDDDDGHDGDGSISMMFNLRIVSRSGQSVGLQGDFAVRTSGSLAI